MGPILKISNLTKKYTKPTFGKKRSVCAVNDLTLSVGKGEIFAFLGPNGAGKTTTIGMLIGLIRPTSGSIELFGEKLRSGNIQVKKRIGYLCEYPYLPEYYRVYELLNFYCDIF